MSPSPSASWRCVAVASSPVAVVGVDRVVGSLSRRRHGASSPEELLSRQRRLRGRVVGESVESAESVVSCPWSSSRSHPLGRGDPLRRARGRVVDPRREPLGVLAVGSFPPSWHTHVPAAAPAPAAAAPAAAPPTAPECCQVPTRRPPGPLRHRRRRRPRRGPALPTTGYQSMVLVVRGRLHVTLGGPGRSDAGLVSGRPSSSRSSARSRVVLVDARRRGRSRPRGAARRRAGGGPSSAAWWRCASASSWASEGSPRPRGPAPRPRPARPRPARRPGRRRSLAVPRRARVSARSADGAASARWASRWAAACAARPPPREDEEGRRTRAEGPSWRWVLSSVGCGGTRGTTYRPAGTERGHRQGRPARWSRGRAR